MFHSFNEGFKVSTNSLYQLYLKDTFKLAKTLVIKSTVAAESINNAIKKLGHTVDETDPTTWRYYLHLNGQYHYLDKEMTVISFDTLEEIAFTKENMAMHRATAKAYSYGTPYYHALVDKYPKQEQLVMGIINPVSISTAIAAEDHAILTYDTSLVESNETNLIIEVEEWIKAYFYRYYNSGYTIHHDLYSAAFYGSIGSLLPAVICEIRNRNCHTPRVHSFHLWAFLNSHGNLRKYREYLTTEQALWLYRNIRWLRCNAGKQSNLDTLIDHLLTKRNIPVASISARQNLEKLTTDLLPTVELVTTPLNFTDSQTPRVVTVKDIVDREATLAKYNLDNSEKAIANAEFEYARSRVSDRPTKVIESNAIDRSDALPFKLIDVLANHWLYLSQSGRYKVMLSLQNPANSASFTMTIKDAFAAWVYFFNKARGVTLTHLPIVRGNRLLRNPVPAQTSLWKLVNKRYWSQPLMDAYYKDTPAIGLRVSTEAFFELGVEIHENMLRRRNLSADRQHLHARANAAVVEEAFYFDAEYDLGSNTTYTEWFYSRGLESLTELSRADSELLSENIFIKAVGQDLSTRHSLREIQAALLKLMTQLCSYNIQFISTTSGNPVWSFGTPELRYGDSHTFTKSEIHLVPPSVEVTTRHFSKGSNRTDFINDSVGTSSRGYSKGRSRIASMLGVSARNRTITKHRGLAPDVEFTVRDTTVPPANSTVLPEVVENQVLNGFYTAPLTPPVENDPI